MDNPTQDCGGCAGPAPLPGVRFNAPGLPAIDYRIGQFGQFKAAMLARLSSTRYPALRGLRTRDDDDPSIALLDAGAMMLDVLGFYQERIASEGFLRTAVEPRSVLELGRLIGYRPSPGVAASTYLAFQLEDAPGLPALAARPVAIPVGTRAQSIPGADEQPQTFETVAPATGRVEWNAMPVQTREPQNFAKGTRELYVGGIGTQVQPGDVLLLVGDERALLDPTSERWDARVVTSVETDAALDHTCLRWQDGLGETPTLPAARGVRAYVFRLRTSLFGHNAADARLMRLSDDSLDLTTSSNLSPSSRRWKNYEIMGDKVDLDGAHAKVLVGSWFLLAGGRGGPGSASLPGWVELYRVAKVTHLSRSDFGLSGKVTRLQPDTDEHLDKFRHRLQETVVHAQSDELRIIERPIGHPLFGHRLPLQHQDSHLAAGQMLAVSGKRQRLQVTVDDPALAFRPDGAPPLPVKPGQSYTVLAPPLSLDSAPIDALSPLQLDHALRTQPAHRLRWRLADRLGRAGELDAPVSAVALVPAAKADAVVAELVSVLAVPPASGVPTQLHLASALANVYDRGTVTVCANLAAATHGEAVGELAGSGNAAVPDQRFALKHAPLTHVSADTPSGRRSTLVVRVDGEQWREVPTLFGRGGDERVYALRQDADQRTIVQFGDGLEGARPPTGRDNLRFGYRKFLGAEGNVRAGQLSTLLGRPLGVKGVVNPVAASGGQGAETLDEARAHAPLATLTLGRAVSLQDYTDFSRSFAGIAKALAVWTRVGGRRGIFISVAGPDGAAVAADGQTCANLAKALRRHGDPLLPLWLHGYRPAYFRLRARVRVAATASAGDVLPKVVAALRQHYGFAARDFGQSASLDEAMAVAHRIAGVEAVDIDQFHRLDSGSLPALEPRLFAWPPKALADGSLRAGEILTLAEGPSGLVLEEMP